VDNAFMPLIEDKKDIFKANLNVFEKN